MLADRERGDQPAGRPVASLMQFRHLDARELVSTELQLPRGCVELRALSGRARTTSLLRAQKFPPNGVRLASSSVQKARHIYVISLIIIIVCVRERAGELALK